MQGKLDFSKLFCNIHPFQVVTNFCNDQKCLIGLCATCICTHTQIHAKIGTVPQYENIRDTFANLLGEVRHQIASIDDDKNRLGRLRQSVDVNKITIKKTIRQLKDQTIEKVKEQFQTLQKKIMNDITNEEKKQGFHSHLRFQTLNKSLNRQNETAHSYIDGLNSSNFLEYAKRLKKSILLDSDLIRKNLEKEIYDNQIYTANLKWNQLFVNEFVNNLKKMFTLEFILPQQNQFKAQYIPSIRQMNDNVVMRASSLSKNSMMRSSSIMGSYCTPAQSNKQSMMFIRDNMNATPSLSHFDKENLSQSTFFPGNASELMSKSNLNSISKVGVNSYATIRENSFTSNLRL